MFFPIDGVASLDLQKSRILSTSCCREPLISAEPTKDGVLVKGISPSRAKTSCGRSRFREVVLVRRDASAREDGAHRFVGVPGRTRTCDPQLRRLLLYPPELRGRAGEVAWSGREDSNLRPPAPKAGALTRLRYTPTIATVASPAQQAFRARAFRQAVCAAGSSARCGA